MEGILPEGVAADSVAGRRYIATFKEHKGLYMVLAPMVSKYWFHLGFNVMFFLVHLPCLMYTAYYTVYVVEDIAMAAEAAHFTIVIISALGINVCVYLKKSSIQNIVRKITDGVYHYDDTLDPATRAEIEEMTGAMRKQKKRLMTIVEIIYNGFFFNCVVTFPILAGKFQRKPYDERYEGIERQAFLQSWIFYSTEGWPLFILAQVTEYYIGCSILCLLDGSDIPFIGFSEEMVNEVKVVNLTLREVMRRASYLYEKKSGKKAESYEDLLFTRCLRQCLRDSVRHHVANNRLFEDLRTAYSGSVFFIMMTAALMMCMSGMIFVSKRVIIGTKLAFMFYLTGELTHVFIFSYYGEKITEMSEENREMAYNMRWEECSKAMLPYVLLIQCRTNGPLRLGAGRIIYCCFDTFGSIISSAYSYFNLLSAATDF